MIPIRYRLMACLLASVCTTSALSAKPVKKVKSDAHPDKTLTKMVEPKKKKSTDLLGKVSSYQNYRAAPLYNQDLAMLKLRQKLNRKKVNRGPYPYVELGGSVIAVAKGRIPPTVPPASQKTESDINLSGANVNLAAEITPLILGTVRISYNPNGPERIDDTTITTRVSNSAIFLNTAFFTLGDLSRSPFYVSAGQMFLPFGAYGTSLVSAPLSARVGRIRNRPIIIGFQEPGTDSGFHASAFVFRGDSYHTGRKSKINNVGGNIGYILPTDALKFTAGASYIANIADAGGFQRTGPSTVVTDAGDQLDNEFLDEEDDEDFGPVTAFRGFGANGTLVHTVPAYDLRGNLDFKSIPLSFYAELVQATRSFDESNLSFNNEGAKPSAWNAEAAVRFKLFHKTNLIGVGYGRSQQALALNLPLYTISATYRVTVYKVVNLAIGYQFEEAYPEGDFATGQDLPVSGNRTVGTHSNTLSLQTSVKF